MKIAITNLRVSSTKYIVHCTLNILHAFFPDGPVISGEAIAITIGHSMLIRPVLISKKNEETLDSEVKILIPAMITSTKN